MLAIKPILSKIFRSAIVLGSDHIANRIPPAITNPNSSVDIFFIRVIFGLLEAVRIY